MNDYFPKRFTSSVSLAYYGKLKERTLLTLKYLETEDDGYLETIEKMTQDLYTLTPPILLDGSKDSYMLQLEKEQSQLFSSLEEIGIANPEQLSLLRFYSLIEKKEDEKLRSQAKQRANGKGRL